VKCPRCGANERVYKLKKPFSWTCCYADCGGRKGYRFSVTTATIFQDTKVSLVIWFSIGYMMLTAKKGISSLQVRRVMFGEDSGTDWRTVWYICHRWRAAMKGDAFALTGQIEVDETLCVLKIPNACDSRGLEKLEGFFSWSAGGAGDSTATPLHANRLERADYPLYSQTAEASARRSDHRSAFTDQSPRQLVCQAAFRQARAAYHLH
jgi:hypothetical protein